MTTPTAGNGASGRLAGGFLVATAAVTAFMVWARLAADADHPTVAAVLSGISDSPGWYGLSGGARLLSGLTLIVAAWCLCNTWIIKQRLGTPMVPWLLGVSGGFTAVSGLAALLLGMSVPALLPFALDREVSVLLDGVLDVRWITGKIGFALAGLALIVASRYQWKVGGALRRVAPGSAIVGIAMQVIWLASATPVHPVVGGGFLLWLMAVGTMLLTGRTEQLFVKMLAHRAPSTTEGSP